MKGIRIAALLVAGLIGAAPAAAQEEEGRSTAVLTLAGVGAGAVGFLGGFYLGAVTADDPVDDDDLSQFTAGLVGAVIGESLLLPLGVHLADGRRGSYVPAALVSLGLAAVGVAALEATHFDSPWAPAIVVTVPIGQLAASIAIERGTAD